MASNRTEALFDAGKSMAANAVGKAIDLSDVKTGAIVVTWAGETSGDAVLKLEESLDGIVWFDIAGASATLDSTHKKKLGPYDLGLPKLRASIAHNTETTGTLACIAFCRP
jgi:hypothetical protein